jgi:hypothetical protein
MKRAAAGKKYKDDLADVDGPGLSDEPEHRRKDDYDDRRPHGIDRQVSRLPLFEAVE